MKKGVLLILLLVTTVTYASAFEFCDDGTTGEDNIRIISVDDMLEGNNQEWKWETLQNIELEIRVENKDEEAKDYIIEAAFVENENKVNIVEDRNDLEKEIQLSGGERKSISLEFELEDDTEIGNYNLHIKFYKRGDEDEECVENSEEQITIEKIELCKNENVDKEDLEITKITDWKQDNNEEWKWTPGNEIEISVDISNKEYSERDFIIELIMLNEENNEVNFAKDNSEIIEERTIDENEEETTTFNFKLDQDIKEGEYNLYAKVYDEENENICTILKAEEISNYKQIEIKRERNNVIVTTISGPTEIRTNSETEYTATITNLGNDDEEKVLIIVYNRILEIKETTEIENLKSGEKREVTMSFSLPENSTSGKHNLLFSTEFKYDNKRNIYRGFSDKSDDIKYPITLSENIPEIIPEEIIEDEIANETLENETIIEDIIEEEDDSVNSPITGNVVGTSEETSRWPIVIGIFFVAIIGIFLYVRKSKKKKAQHTAEEPIVNRRYTASLGSH